MIDPPPRKSVYKVHTLFLKVTLFIIYVKLNEFLTIYICLFGNRNKKNTKNESSSNLQVAQSSQLELQVHMQHQRVIL